MQLDFIDHEPLTEEQALGLIPKGETVQARVEKCEIRTDKNSKKVFVHTLGIEYKGNYYTITQWLFMPFLVKHFYESTGQADKYQEKKLAISDHVGKTVYVKIGIKEADENYRAKNIIYDFVKAPEKKLGDGIPDFDDPLPF